MSGEAKRIALAQVELPVGAFEANARKVREVTARARAAGATLVIFPELGIAGYPPKDLLYSHDFLARYARAMDELCKPDAWNQGICVLMGGLERHKGGKPGCGLFNAALLIENGVAQRSSQKRLLPNYDVFDETRYFDEGERSSCFTWQGLRVGVTLCEDIWNSGMRDEAPPRPAYGLDPVEELVHGGAELIVNLSASPFAAGKARRREALVRELASARALPVAYVNSVGANDRLVFDGNSFVMGAGGALLARAVQFEEQLLVVDLDQAPKRGEEPAPLLCESGRGGELEEVLRALSLGLASYSNKSGFNGVVLGLSGGIDSAVVAALAARALGPERVLGVAMPSRFTAQMSNDDAAALASNLGIEYRVIPIEPICGAFLDALAPSFAGLAPDVTEENLQARVRGTLLMALANKHRKLLLTTGNKSEVAVGYCTLYGDMSGGLSLLGDLYKTEVFELARHLNQSGEIIPERTIARPPTAELREGQRDDQSLPPYEQLDAILRGHIEGRMGLAELVAAGHPEKVVRRVLSLHLSSEFKRWQAAPILRLSERAFGEGWRYPLSHALRYT